MEVILKSTGSIVTGNVNDGDYNKFLTALQNYDPLLYLKWNPKKKSGNGCWEIRRKSATLHKVFVATIDNIPIYELKAEEIDHINHVLDIDCISERYLNRIYEMDTSKVHNWVDKTEYEAKRAREKLEKDNREELRYQIKSDIKQFATLFEEMQRGYNPFIKNK